MFLVKFFKSPIWSDRLIALAEGLVARKGEIEFALSIHTAVGVDATLAAVDKISSKIDVLTSIVHRHTKREKQLEKLVIQLGGRDAIIDDPNMLETMAEAIVQQVDHDERDASQLFQDGFGKPSNLLAEAKAVKERSTDSKQTGDGGKVIPEKTKATIVNPSIRHALNASLDSLLEDNARIYTLKLEQQTKLIQDALDASTLRMLRKFDAGPYERILHPVSHLFTLTRLYRSSLFTQDIRALWKDMNWRTTVKARHFVTALHDYFIDMFAQTNVAGLTGTPDIAVALGNNPLASPPSDIYSHSPSDDRWCLHYMTLEYVPAIMEAFDDDASGFVITVFPLPYLPLVSSGLLLIGQNY